MNRLQLTYRGFPQSEALSEFIRDHAEDLRETFDGIVACHVVIEQPHKHHSQGREFSIHVVIEVPRKEIAITRRGVGSENAYQAASEAFRAARVQLSKYADKLKGQVKEHSLPALGS